MSGCFNVTNRGVELIPKKFPSLITLDSDMCEVSFEQIIILVEQCSQLVGLHIEHSHTFREQDR